jgi:hypothetical protein
MVERAGQQRILQHPDVVVFEQQLEIVGRGNEAVDRALGCGRRFGYWRRGGSGSRCEQD